MAQASISEVESMLAECAPGSTIKMKTHFRHVYHPNGKVYTALPKYDNMQVLHIRKMARFFGILECAKKHIPSI